MILIKNALLSVSDKSHLLSLVKNLSDKDVHLYATESTYATITDAGFQCKKVSDYTNFPEILHGRVKTLHPKIFGGILGRNRILGEREELASHKIVRFDLVCVNLYPFSTVAATTDDQETLLDTIDIGGVALLRAAAKNFPECITLSSPEQYSLFMENYLQNNGSVSLAIAKQFMIQAFLQTSMYDSRIVQKFSEENIRSLYLKNMIPLTYGENPHQKASFLFPLQTPYQLDEKPLGCNQLHGKGLSYNNILDLGGGLDLLDEFHDVPSVVILKHTSPCGAASNETIEEAYKNAYACDPISAFGGVFLLNQTVTSSIAEQIHSVFVDVICAPAYTEEAFAILRKKKNVRILQRNYQNSLHWRLRDAGNGFLFQEKDKTLFETLDVVTGEALTEKQKEDIIFGIKTLKYVKSNAILLCKDQSTLGIGTGQPNRVDSVRIALTNATKQQPNQLSGSILCSDAFFPFSDSLQEIHTYGVHIVVEPGGSIRDQQVIDTAKKLGITLVFTGQRHFLH